MASVTIVSGAPGTGKTTVAAWLAKRSPHGLHIASDVFYTFPAAAIAPHLPAAREQNATMMVALSRATAAFASGGYDVYLDGIFGPWFLPLVTAELSTVTATIHYVVLRAPLEVALARVRGRRDDCDEAVVREMHRQFEDLGGYARHAVATSQRTSEDVAAEIALRISREEFVLRPAEGRG